MKHWINSNYKTLIISAFLIPIITVAIVSISHVTQWYGISNPLSWAIYLSVGIEIAAMSALAAISANMGKNVYFPFIIVTLIQFIGNIFFAYEYIDMTSKMFQSWVELVSPLVGFMGVEPTDLIGHKRFLALFAGGLLPVISLSFLHMLVKFTEEDRLKDVKEDEEIHHKVVEEKIKHDIEETVTVDPELLKNLVEDAVRVKLSEKDLEVLENALLNPPPPNEELIKAYDNYKVNFTDSAVKKLDELIDERSKELDDEMDHLIPNHPMMNDIIGGIPIEPTKEEIEERDRVKFNETNLNNLEKFLTKKYEDPYDKELEEEFNEWDVTLQDGLEDEPSYEESSDNLPIEEPYEEPEIEDFDGDLMDDYYPMKFETDYFLGNNGKTANVETLSEREQFMNEIYDEIIEEDKKKLTTNIEENEPVVEEDKKKDQTEYPSVEENTQFSPSEETQDLTNDVNSVYFEQDETKSNPLNINRKILSRNVNNTRRRGF